MRSRITNYILQNQVLTAILVVSIVWMIVMIKDVLIALFIAYILMAAIIPYVEFLLKNRVPKPIAVVVPYITAMAGLFLIVIALLPFFITQIQILFATFPAYLNQDFNIFGNKLDASQINSIVTSELENITQNAFSVTTKVFGGVISALSIIAISFYLLLYRETVNNSFINLFSGRYQPKVDKTMKQVEEKLGSWLRGQLILSGSIGILTWVILTVLGVEFALPLAVLAGILEIVPTIGPIIAAIPAIIVALSVSPVLAIIVAVSYFFIQLFENNFLVPRIMQRAVGLNPIVIIIGIIVGGQLLGIVGALLAIPFISLLVVIYKNLD